MNRTLIIVIGLLFLLLAGVIYIDSNAPKKIDWTPTYSTKDKIPYGLYVVEQEIKSIFKGSSIEKIKKTPYEYFNESTDTITDYTYTENQYDTIKNYNTPASELNQKKDTIENSPKENINYLCVCEFCYIDDQSVNELMGFVKKGNTVFISAKSFPQSLQDSLKIKMDADLPAFSKANNWIANKKLGTKKYNIFQGAGRNYFSKTDTLNTTILGYHSLYKDSVRVNFIKVKYGTGQFLLHTQPVAFTNYHMLKEDHYEYVQTILSYIPKGNFIQSLKGESDQDKRESSMRFWNSQPALRWAWWLFIIGMLLFMLFNAKRKQRIVPIKKPLANTTVDFTKTIGNLYFLEGDHDNIINKKIVYFLERIRHDYLIDTTKLDDDFIKKLYQKSGKDMASIQKVVFLINTHRRSPHNSIEEDLIQINKAIENILH
jgi:hypothetical protein